MARLETYSFTDSNVTNNQTLGNTINAVTVSFSVGLTKHDVVAPAGTRCCLLDGPNQRWVVDDLSFIDSKSGVFTDASNYGIPIDPANLTDIRPSTL